MYLELCHPLKLAFYWAIELRLRRESSTPMEINAYHTSVLHIDPG